MRNAIRKPKKSIKLSKWVMLLAYVFVVLTVSCSVTLAKYITTSTLDDAARVATAGEYTIRLSEYTDDDDYEYLQNNDWLPITIGADSANDYWIDNIYIFNDLPTETACSYSIVVKTTGTLPLKVELELTGEISSGKPVDLANPDSELIEKLTDAMLSPSETEINKVWAWSNGVFEVNQKAYHPYQIKITWDGPISTDEEELKMYPDDFELNSKIEKLSISIIVNQEDEYIK